MFSIDQAPESRESFQLLPAGFWQVKITGLELKQNKDGRGSQFAFNLGVISPHDYADCKFTHRCTYESQNETAKRIGHAELADLLYTCQIRGFGNVDELQRLCVGKEVIIETELEEDDQNRLWPRVIGVWSLGGKHRNPQRNKEIKLGQTDRPPRQRKAKAAPSPFSGGGFQIPPQGNNGYQQQASSNRPPNPFDDVPF